MERAWAVLERIGVQPLGFRSPSADLSPLTLELVEELGFLYDSSLMTDDYRPFHPRIGDRVARGLAARARPRGAVLGAAAVLRARRLGAFPVQLRPYRKGGAPPSHVLEIWRAEFDFMDENVDGGVLTVCMHPQVIGRGHRIAMLDELIVHCRDAGARFERMADVAERLG